MKNLKSVLTLNIIIFSLVFILHLVRSITSLNAQIGNWIVPIWLSYIGVIVAAYLIYINYKQVE